MQLQLVSSDTRDLSKAIIEMLKDEREARKEASINKPLTAQQKRRLKTQNGVVLTAASGHQLLDDMKVAAQEKKENAAKKRKEATKDASSNGAASTPRKKIAVSSAPVVSAGASKTTSTKAPSTASSAVAAPKDSADAENAAPTGGLGSMRDVPDVVMPKPAPISRPKRKRKRRATLSDDESDFDDEKNDIDDGLEVLKTFCVCDKPEKGDYIRCDNKHCTYGRWFHASCIGMTDEQFAKQRDYLCSGCKECLRSHKRVRTDQN